MFTLFKRKNPFDYPGIEPPFKFKPLQEMTKEEAQRHFDWFVAQSEPRRKLLINAIAATGGDAAAFDYSPESLIPLWVAMSRLFEARPMTQIEKDAFQNSLPAAAKQLKKFDNPKELTTATLCYAIDIGFYVAEVYMRYYPQVRWALWQGKDIGFNKAALSGFKLPLIPSDMVCGSVWKHFKTPKQTLLLDIYRVWEKELLHSVIPSLPDNSPVLKIDDAHWMNQPKVGEMPRDPYRIAPCSRVILDATDYVFDHACELRDKPINSIQIVQNKTLQFELDWKKDKTRYELSKETLRPLRGSQSFEGFNFGDKCLVSIGVLEPPRKFNAVWISLIEVQ
jgi:hypothetical protein